MALDWVFFFLPFILKNYVLFYKELFQNSTNADILDLEIMQPCGLKDLLDLYPKKKRRKEINLANFGLGRETLSAMYLPNAHPYENDDLCNLLQ